MACGRQRCHAESQVDKVTAPAAQCRQPGSVFLVFEYCEHDVGALLAAWPGEGDQCSVVLAEGSCLLMSVGNTYCTWFSVPQDLMERPFSEAEVKCLTLQLLKVGTLPNAGFAKLLFPGSRSGERDSLEFQVGN